MCYAAACTKGRSRTDHLATAHYLLGVLQPHMLSPEPAAGAARSGRYVLGGAILSPWDLDEIYGLLKQLKVKSAPEETRGCCGDFSEKVVYQLSP